MSRDTFSCRHHLCLHSLIISQIPDKIVLLSWPIRKFKKKKR